MLSEELLYTVWRGSAAVLEQFVAWLGRVTQSNPRSRTTTAMPLNSILLPLKIKIFFQRTNSNLYCYLLLEFDCKNLPGKGLFKSVQAGLKKTWNCKTDVCDYRRLNSEQTTKVSLPISWTKIRCALMNTIEQLKCGLLRMYNHSLTEMKQVAFH